MSIALAQSFTVITCYKCGIAFAVPDHWRAKRLEDKRDFWCPNGHCQAYTVSTPERLRKELEDRDRKLQQALNRETILQGDLEKANRAKKRLAKRLESGVCPYPGCKRHFTNLQRHLSTEHHGVALPATENEPRQIQ